MVLLHHTLQTSCSWWQPWSLGQTGHPEGSTDYHRRPCILCRRSSHVSSSTQNAPLLPVFRRLLKCELDVSLLNSILISNPVIIISVRTIQGKVDRSDPVLIILCSSVVQYRSSTQKSQSGPCVNSSWIIIAHTAH